MRIRAWIRAYFGFSKTETNGFLVLIPMILLALWWNPLAGMWMQPDEAILLSDRKKLDSLLAMMKWDSAEAVPAEFFPFDPNSADSITLARLGLQKQLVGRIMSYRAHGGKFRRREDLLKIYGIDTAWYDRVKAYAHIQPRKSTQEKKKVRLVDINLADSLQLMVVRGIGPVLSRRIRRYRDKLGGFITMQQLGEVYGLDTLVRIDIASKFFIAEGFQPVRFNINEVNLEELSQHPYCRWAQARAIILYRFQHGPFESGEDLQKVRGITPDWVDRIRPYLKFR